MKKTEDPTMACYRRLAMTICTQAIRDYINGTERDRKEITKFLLSPTFAILSGGMDGGYIIRMLDNRIKEGGKV